VHVQEYKMDFKRHPYAETYIFFKQQYIEYDISHSIYLFI